MTKMNETENQCRCQTTDCGCEGNPERCSCEAPCRCKEACGCGTSCSCATKK